MFLQQSLCILSKRLNMAALKRCGIHTSSTNLLFLSLRVFEAISPCSLVFKCMLHTTQIGNGREIDLRVAVCSFPLALADHRVVQEVCRPELSGSFRLLRAGLQLLTELCICSHLRVVINRREPYCTVT